MLLHDTCCETRAYQAIEWERELTWLQFSILNQEHIEPVKGHATTIDCKIQTWLLDTNFSNIQILEGSNVCMHTWVCRVLDTVQE